MKNKTFETYVISVGLTIVLLAIVVLLSIMPTISAANAEEVAADTYSSTVNIKVEIRCKGDPDSSSYTYIPCPANSVLDLSYDGNFARQVRSYVSQLMSWPKSTWDGFYLTENSDERLLSYNIGSNEMTLWCYYTMDPCVGLMVVNGSFKSVGFYTLATFGDNGTLDLTTHETQIVPDDGYSFSYWSTSLSESGRLTDTVIDSSKAGNVYYAICLLSVPVRFEIYVEGTEASSEYTISDVAPYSVLDLSLDGDISRQIKSHVSRIMSWPKSHIEGFYVSGEKVTSVEVPKTLLTIKVKYEADPYVNLQLTNGDFLYGGNSIQAYFDDGGSLDLTAYESSLVLPDGYSFVCWSTSADYSGKLADPKLSIEDEGKTFYGVVLPDVNLTIYIYCREDPGSSELTLTYPPHSELDLSYDGDLAARVRSYVSQIMSWPQSTWDGFYASKDSDVSLDSYHLGESDESLYVAYKVKPYLTFWYLSADGFSWYSERAYYSDGSSNLDMSVSGYHAYEAAEVLGIEVIGYSDTYAGKVYEDNIFGPEHVGSTLYAAYSCSVQIGFVSAKEDKDSDSISPLRSISYGEVIVPRKSYSGQYIELPTEAQAYIDTCLSGGKIDTVTPQVIDTLFFEFLKSLCVNYDGGDILFKDIPLVDSKIPTVSIFSFYKFLDYVDEYAQSVNPDYEKLFDVDQYNVVLVPTSGSNIVYDDDGDGIPNQTTLDKISDWFGNLWNSIKESSVFQKAKVAIMIVLGVLAILVLLPLIPYLFQFVVFVITLPIKAIRAIARAVKKNK